MHLHPPARLALVVLTASACARNGDTASFSGGPGPGLDSASTGAGGSDTSTSTSTSSGTASGDASTGAAVGSSGTFDVGVQPDFEPTPVGCKGKIDFLFLISRLGLMRERQDQLTAAFPQFIDTIESKFADFDYHIMVVDGDDVWGHYACTDNCPTLECKVGDHSCCDWWDPDDVGKPCCSVPDYPCDSLGLVDPCDWVYGSGTTIPAGGSASNKPCPIDGDQRYLVKGQHDLKETFACIATVGVSGDDRLGQALTAAMQKPINDYGGCNEHFLRDDALLMVTLISSTWETTEFGSEGTPAEWAKAVLDAKHGDERSVVMFNIGDPDCEDENRLCHLTNMFPFHHQVAGAGTDYGPGFAEAASLVDTACAEFVPPPG